MVAPRALRVASMARMNASVARIDASMLRKEPSMALLGRTCGASGRPRSRMGRTVGVPYAALGRAGPHQVANIAQLFPLEIAVWRSLIPKSRICVYIGICGIRQLHFFRFLNFDIFKVFLTFS